MTYTQFRCWVEKVYTMHAVKLISIEPYRYRLPGTSERISLDTSLMLAVEPDPFNMPNKTQTDLSYFRCSLYSTMENLLPHSLKAAQISLFERLFTPPYLKPPQCSPRAKKTKTTPSLTGNCLPLPPGDDRANERSHTLSQTKYSLRRRIAQYLIHGHLKKSLPPQKRLRAKFKSGIMMRQRSMAPLCEF